MLPVKATTDSTRTPREDRASKAHRQTAVRGWKWFLRISLASLFFLLGVLGMLIPGLPATPFLLLTSYFLVRSSPRLNERLLRSRLFGPVLVDWQVHGGIRPHVRVKAILAVVLAVGLTIYLSAYSTWISLTVVAFAMVGVGVILRLPNAREASAAEDAK